MTLLETRQPGPLCQSATCASEQTSSKGVDILWITESFSSCRAGERKKKSISCKKNVFIPSMYSFMQCFRLHLLETKALSYACSHEHFAINRSSRSRTVKNESRKTQVTGGQARQKLIGSDRDAHSCPHSYQKVM